MATRSQAQMRHTEQDVAADSASKQPHPCNRYWELTCVFALGRLIT